MRAGIKTKSGMSESNIMLEECGRFYKVSCEGRWQRKSPHGSYEEMKSRAALKRLQIAVAKSLGKRIE